MPGGRIAPDGRPPQTPGVGKNAKRHDLEAPATPGLHGSDLQQGDVSMLEQGQRVAPRPKKNQPKAAAPQRARTTQSRQGGMEVPDPIEFAGQKLQGGMGASVPVTPVDPTPWMPLLRQMATTPGAGGGMTAAFAEQLSAFVREPNTSKAYLIDLNEADEALGL